MAIKKLQNNFTTTEQSKRLLELGVPANSADLYTQLGFENLIWIRNTKSELSEDFFDILLNLKQLNTPIWSVGRLREIFCICSSVNGTREYPFCNDQVVWWITEFEFKKEYIDFSKLEE